MPRLLSCHFLLAAQIPNLADAQNHATPSWKIEISLSTFCMIRSMLNALKQYHLIILRYVPQQPPCVLQHHNLLNLSSIPVFVETTTQLKCDPNYPK